MAISREQAIQELQRRRGNVSSVSPMQSSVSKQDAMAELQRRGKSIPAREPGFGENAFGLAKGAISGLVGGAADTASLLYNLPATIHNASLQAAQQNPMAFKGTEYEYVPDTAVPSQLPTIPSAVHGIEQGIENTTGIKTPEDMRGIYEGLKFAGELGSSGGVGKIAGKLGMRGLEKAGTALGATAPSHLAGATAAGTTMHNVGEEYGPAIGLPAGALAGALATKGAGAIGQFGKGLKGTLTGKGQSIGDMTIGQAISRMGIPKKEVEELIKETGKDIPFNVRLSGRASNFIANTLLNGTIFSSKKWNNLIENTPKSTLDDITKSLNKIHPENVGAEGSSKLYREELDPNFKELKEIQNELYNNSEKVIKKDDYIILDNNDPTVKGLVNLRNRYDVWSPSRPAKAAMKKVNELGIGLGILPTPTKELESFLENPVNFNTVIDHLTKKGIKVPLDKFVRQKSELMKDIDWRDVGGPNDALKGLSKNMEESIQMSPNKEFLGQREVANKFHKENIAGRVRSDMARALTEGTTPKLAYEYMNDPQNIKELHRILGDSSKSNQIMNALKRAKLKDVFEDTLMGADKEINWGAFANLFTKKNEKQDLLRELLGKESYNDLHKLSHLASQYSKSGKMFSNASGTALRAQDIVKLSMIPTTLGTAVAGGAAAGATMGLSTIAGIGTPYVMSRLLANPRYTNAAVKLFEARSARNSKEVTRLERMMKSMAFDYAKKEIPHEINQVIENQ